MEQGTFSSWTNTRSDCGCRNGTRRPSALMLARHKIGDRKLELSDLKSSLLARMRFHVKATGTTIAAQYAKHGINVALRQHEPAERLGGSHDAVRRHRGRYPAETVHPSAVRATD